MNMSAWAAQAAPYDVLRADESLSQEELTTALGVSSMWTAAHAYPLLPYSCVIMESIPESEAVMGVSPRQQAAVDEPAMKRSKVAGGGKESQRSKLWAAKDLAVQYLQRKQATASA